MEYSLPFYAVIRLVMQKHSSLFIYWVNDKEKSFIILTFGRFSRRQSSLTMDFLVRKLSSLLISGCHNKQHKSTQHNDNQHNDIQHNNIQLDDIQHNEAYHNDIQHYDIQHNHIQHNDIQHNDSQYNDTELNNSQYNDTHLNSSQYNDTQQNAIRCNDIQLYNKQIPHSAKHYAECHHAEWRFHLVSQICDYLECHYAKCHGTLFLICFIIRPVFVVFSTLDKLNNPTSNPVYSLVCSINMRVIF